MARKAASKSNSVASTKGKLVEQIVASMHKFPGYDVETNVFLPVLSSDNNRKREIDVLVKANVVGYPVQIAIECKNFKKVIGVQLIDEFIGKLEDIGIPHQHGIYVTARHFSKGAVERARKKGIRLYTITGLTQDRMASIINNAVYSLIFLVANISKITIETASNSSRTALMVPCTNIPVLLDSDGHPSGDVATEVWTKWGRGDLSTLIGTHEYRIDPTGLYIGNEGDIEPVTSILVTIDIIGLVTDFGGQVTYHQLLSSSSNGPEKSQVNFKFDHKPGTFALKGFRSEHELTAYLNSHSEIAKVSQRVMVPRIWFDHLYWPPSEKALQTLEQQSTDQLQGFPESPYSLDVNSIEGSQLNAAWEPISPRYFDLVKSSGKGR